MLTASNAELIASTAAPRPNGADQAHGMRMLGRRAHLSVVRASTAAQASPKPTGPECDEGLPWSSLRPLFLCILGLAFVVSALAARVYVFGH